MTVKRDETQGFREPTEPGAHAVAPYRCSSAGTSSSAAPSEPWTSAEAALLRELGAEGRQDGLMSREVKQAAFSANRLHRYLAAAADLELFFTATATPRSLSLMPPSTG